MKDAPKAIEAVWKIESTRLIAALARVTHDVGVAEELAQDALVTALELWPEEGIPENRACEAARERAEQMGARFIDARETPWLICSCGEVLVLVEDAAAGVM
jgi:predicted RNA polymerase sigma factor